MYHFGTIELKPGKACIPRAATDETRIGSISHSAIVWPIDGHKPPVQQFMPVHFFAGGKQVFGAFQPTSSSGYPFRDIVPAFLLLLFQVVGTHQRRCFWDLLNTCSSEKQTGKNH